MARATIAAIVAAAVVFAWGFVAWPTLHLYQFAFPPLKNEAAVTRMLRESTSGNGAYVIPSLPPETPATTNQQSEQAWEAFAARHREGPIAVLLYRSRGEEPMHWTVLARGYGINFAGALLLGVMMSSMGLRSFSRRLVFGFLVVLCAAVITHASLWNWFAHPDNYAAAVAADTIIGWTLGSIVLAGMVKVKQPAA